MDKCTEPRFQQMIHAFEVGLLTNEDRKAFELHLLDCEACSNEVKSFLPVSGPIRHDPTLRPDEEEVEAIMATDRDEKPVARRKNAKSWPWTARWPKAPSRWRIWPVCSTWTMPDTG